MVMIGYELSGVSDPMLSTTCSRIKAREVSVMSGTDVTSLLLKLGVTVSNS